MTTLEDVKRARKVNVFYDPYRHAKELAQAGVGITDICDKTGVHENIAWAFIQMFWNDRLRHAAYAQ